MCHKGSRLAREGTLTAPYLVASAGVTRLAPPRGTRAAPQEVGTEVGPQAQSGLALQAWGIKMAPQLGETRATPQEQGTGLAPQEVLQAEEIGTVPQAWGTGMAPQIGETGKAPQAEGTGVVP